MNFNANRVNAREYVDFSLPSIAIQILNSNHDCVYGRIDEDSPLDIVPIDGGDPIPCFRKIYEGR